mgnify:CR=1 FL=1
MVLIGGILGSADLAAQQTDSLSIADIDYVLRSEGWLSSRNPTGLKDLRVTSVAAAETFFRKSNGGFHNYHQSDNSYSYGLDVQSFHRLDENLVLSGSFLYDAFTGKHMTGSAFIDPYKNPFNIVEMVESMEGNKELETYHLTGAISGQLNSRLAIGAGIDYQSANYAKMRDLRHVNKLLDMCLSAGGAYQLFRKAGIGVNYAYQRRVESVRFNFFGNTNEQFSSLIDFGAFFGRKERFGNEGYTDETKPLTNIGHAVSLQLNFNFTERSKLFNEFSLTRMKGGFGEDGTDSKLLTEHKVSEYSYRGIVSLAGERKLQLLRLDITYSTGINYENELVRQTEPGGVSKAIFIGKKEVLDKVMFEGKLGYSLFKEIDHNNPGWKLDLDAGYVRRLQTTTLYPFYRDQTLNRYYVQGRAGRCIDAEKRRYNVAIGLAYSAGSGDVKYDGLHTTPSPSQAPAQTMDLYLTQEWEFFTKPAASADLSVKVSQQIKHNLYPYLLVSYSYTRAFDTQFLGDHFNTISARIGCNF